MSCHAVSRIYLELIGFNVDILLKKSEAISFWPVVPILFEGMEVAGLTLSGDSPGRELRAGLTGHLPAKDIDLTPITFSQIFQEILSMCLRLLAVKPLRLCFLYS